jgi:hypothetical protein
MGMGQVIYTGKTKKIILFNQVAAAACTNMRVKKME